MRLIVLNVLWVYGKSNCGLYKQGFIMDHYDRKSLLFGEVLEKVFHIKFYENLLVCVEADKRSETGRKREVTSIFVYSLYFV
jgi:hypothetical protein